MLFVSVCLSPPVFRSFSVKYTRICRARSICHRSCSCHLCAQWYVVPDRTCVSAITRVYFFSRSVFVHALLVLTKLRFTLGPHIFLWPHTKLRARSEVIAWHSR